MMIEPETVWMSREEAAAIAPGLNRGKLHALRVDRVGPAARVLSDGEVLYDELAFRRWLESTVDHDWVHGPFGAHRPPATKARAYTYDDARLDELRARTYISKEQLLALVPGMLASNAAELRAGGVGPRFLRPTPRSVVYVAEEALWWAERIPGYSGRFERGAERDGTERQQLTPPVAVRRPLTVIELARIGHA
ncbi:hypothetical protein [Microbacterium sp. RURRCA19A]|uniref:hypothetical protein n=1 Tax=Microbacterium sp. RURRCA19A TaxID=1907391 RepID=UPI0011155F15|nr:hypothetical protein [Microbacterium sp. RURRCA19A]